MPAAFKLFSLIAIASALSACGGGEAEDDHAAAAIAAHDSGNLQAADEQDAEALGAAAVFRAGFSDVGAEPSSVQQAIQMQDGAVELPAL